MIIRLTDGTNGGSLSFNARDASINWKDQNPTARHLVGYKTGLPKPFELLFIKHWLGRPSDGHALLLSCIANPILGTPAIFAHEQDADGHLYFFQCLPPSNFLLDELLSKYRAQNHAGSHEATLANLFAHNFIEHLVDRVSRTFEEIWKRGYVYTDFCNKNIFVSSSKQICLIDVDSCFPIDSIDQAAQSGLKFDIRYWALWQQYVSRGASKIDGRLPKSMILAFATVWARAFALSRDSSRFSDALAFVHDPPPSAQNDIWHALRDENKAAFANFFGLSDQIDDQYATWASIFSQLRSGAEPSWDDIRKINRDLLHAIVASPQLRVPAKSGTTAVPKTLPQTVQAATIAQMAQAVTLRNAPLSGVAVAPGGVGGTGTNLPSIPVGPSRSPSPPRPVLLAGVGAILFFALLGIAQINSPRFGSEPPPQPQQPVAAPASSSGGSNYFGPSKLGCDNPWIAAVYQQYCAHYGSPSNSAAPNSSPPADQQSTELPPIEGAANSGASLPATGRENLPATVYGFASMIDTGTLKIVSSWLDRNKVGSDGQTVRLFGITGVSGESVARMQTYIENTEGTFLNGGHINCSLADAQSYTCLMNNGEDLATVVLLNGAGRAAPNAPAAYRTYEYEAHMASRGIWAKHDPTGN